MVGDKLGETTETELTRGVSLFFFFSFLKELTRRLGIHFRPTKTIKELKLESSFDTADLLTIAT